MLTSFTTSCNLRNILSSPRIPSVLQHCRTMFETLLSSENRNTLLTEIADEDETITSGTVKTLDSATSRAWLGQAFNPAVLPRVRVLSRLDYNKLHLAGSSTNYGNSLIFANISTLASVPASIKTIFVTENEQSPRTYVSVQRFLPSEPSAKCRYNYASYPVFGAEVWSSANSAEIEVIPLEGITAQCTRTVLPDGQSVFLPLSL